MKLRGLAHGEPMGSVMSLTDGFVWLTRAHRRESADSADRHCRGHRPPRGMHRQIPAYDVGGGYFGAYLKFFLAAIYLAKIIKKK